jgi:hypothetical protein
MVKDYIRLGTLGNNLKLIEHTQIEFGLFWFAKKPEL